MTNPKRLRGAAKKAHEARLDREAVEEHRRMVAEERQALANDAGELLFAAAEKERILTEAFGERTGEARAVPLPLIIEHAEEARPEPAPNKGDLETRLAAIDARLDNIRTVLLGMGVAPGSLWETK